MTFVSVGELRRAMSHIILDHASSAIADRARELLDLLRETDRPPFEVLAAEGKDIMVSLQKLLSQKESREDSDK